MSTTPASSSAPSSTIGLGNVLFRFRSFTPVPVIAVLAWALWRSRSAPGPGGASVDMALNVLGLVIAFAGQVLRFLTLSQVPEGTSGQGDKLEAVVLNTRGPYAHVRNPLYVGNLGICLGLLLIANDPWVYLGGLAFFFGEYFFIIRAEESFLRSRFGAGFDEFCQKVPRWVPRLTAAYDGKLRSTYDFRRGLKKEHNPFAAWALGAIVLIAWESAARGTLTDALRNALIGLAVAVIVAFAVIKAYKRGLLFSHGR